MKGKHHSYIDCSIHFSLLIWICSFPENVTADLTILSSVCRTRTKVVMLTDYSSPRCISLKLVNEASKTGSVRWPMALTSTGNNRFCKIAHDLEKHFQYQVLYDGT